MVVGGGGDGDGSSTLVYDGVALLLKQHVYPIRFIWIWQ